MYPPSNSRKSQDSQSYEVKYNKSLKNLYETKNKTEEFFQLQVQMAGISNAERTVNSLLGNKEGGGGVSGSATASMSGAIKTLQTKNKIEQKIETIKEKAQRLEKTELLDKVQRLNDCVGEKVKIDEGCFLYDGHGSSRIKFHTSKIGAINASVFYKGQCIFQEEVECKEGSNSYIWQGKDKDATQAMKGVYTVKFTSKDPEQLIQSTKYQTLNNIVEEDDQFFALCDGQKVSIYSVSQCFVPKPLSSLTADPCSLIKKNVTIDCTQPHPTANDSGDVEVCFVSPRALTKNEKCFCILYDTQTKTEITKKEIKNLSCGYNNTNLNLKRAQQSLNMQAKVVITDESGKETIINNEHQMEVRGISRNGYVFDGDGNYFPTKNITALTVAKEVQEPDVVQNLAQFSPPAAIDHTKLDEFSALIGATVEYPTQISASQPKVQLSPRLFIPAHHSIEQMAIQLKNKNGDDITSKVIAKEDIPSCAQNYFSIARDYGNLAENSKKEVDAQIQYMTHGVYQDFTALAASDFQGKIDLFSALDIAQKETGIFLDQAQQQKVDEALAQDKDSVRQACYLANRGIVAIDLAGCLDQVVDQEYTIEATITTHTQEKRSVVLSSSDRVKSVIQSDNKYLVNLSSGRSLDYEKILKISK